MTLAGGAEDFLDSTLESVAAIVRTNTWQSCTFTGSKRSSKICNFGSEGASAPPAFTWKESKAMTLPTTLKNNPRSSTPSL